MFQPKPEAISPRVALVEALTLAASAAALVGDTGALKVARDALSALVGSAVGGAEVVDLHERKRRG